MVRPRDILIFTNYASREGNKGGEETNLHLIIYLKKDLLLSKGSTVGFKHDVVERLLRAR